MRASTSVRYLHPNMGRENLTVTTDALALRVLFDEGSNLRRRDRPRRDRRDRSGPAGHFLCFLRFVALG
jgi:hypothetical protein